MICLTNLILLLVLPGTPTAGIMSLALANPGGIDSSDMGGLNTFTYETQGQVTTTWRNMDSENLYNSPIKQYALCVEELWFPERKNRKGRKRAGLGMDDLHDNGSAHDSHGVSSFRACGDTPYPWQVRSYFREKREQGL